MKKIIYWLLIITFTAANGQRAEAVECSEISEKSTQGATVLGNGSPGSVNTSMLQSALDNGGIIRFNLGASAAVINLSAELLISKETIIDGGGLVTLNGGNQHRIMRIENPDNTEFTLTVQNLNFINGRTNTGSGAAIFKPTGGPWQAVSLDVINSHFANNVAIEVDQDAGGGAIYAIGMKEIGISHSSFTNNSGSNGGAFYSLGSQDIKITDSVFDGNHATGQGGNPGSGGNAGAIGVDGGERLIRICRSQIVNNTARAFGAGFFSVMYDQNSLTAFVDTTFESNINNPNFGLAGGAYIQGGPLFISRSSFINNQARGAGGLFLGPNANGEIINSTIYGNIALNTLGGGISIDQSADVDLIHLTIVANHAPCAVCFAGGISVGANNQVSMWNSILAENTGGNEFNPWNILSPIAGSNNVQYPQFRPNGQQEIQATTGTIWEDPMTLAVNDNGGFTPTAAVQIGGSGVHQADPNFSTTSDQRMIGRFLAPDIGAYERTLDIIFIDGFE